jgi:hypothetical protein
MPIGYCTDTCKLFAAGVLLLCSGYLGASAETPQIVDGKLAETRALEEQAASRSNYGAYASPQVRPGSDRDSGHNESLMFVNNVFLRTFGEIGYLAEKVVVAARPKDPAKPVIMDDPQSFDLVVLSGRVIVPPKALTELVGSHVFNFDGSPLRQVRVETKPDLLVMSGEMNRKGKWVSFLMEGKIVLVENSTLAFTPSRTEIDGKSANALIEAANLDLDEIISLKAPGVTLNKSTVYLNPGGMFPPPALTLSVKSAKVEERGLILEGTSKGAPAFPEPIVKSDSYVLIRGGDVKFLNMMPVNILMQIMAESGGSPRLDFSLYDYRTQLAAGHLKFRPDGGVLVFLRNYTELKSGDSTR